MADNWIKTIALCRYYTRGRHEVKAVDQVSLSLQKGEFMAIVGASGSGKSTLLNLIAGLDSPTSGHIEFEGVTLDSLSRKELASYRAHKVGMIFQSFNLMPHLTALENVEWALYFNDTPRRKRREMALEILDTLGMSDRIDHHPADLSGGEQQRVAVARALVKKPEILFADEPTGNLDRDNSAQIAKLINDLNQRGLTIVMVTHDLDLAANHAARIVRMNYGRVVDDSPITGEAEKVQ